MLIIIITLFHLFCLIVIVSNTLKIELPVQIHAGDDINDTYCSIAALAESDEYLEFIEDVTGTNRAVYLHNKYNLK